MHLIGTSTPPAPSPVGYPCTSAGIPHPVRAFGGIPIRFCRRPPPRPRLRGDTHALLRPPPPRPRLRRSSPAPTRGRGQCLRYRVNSRTRGGAGGPPCPALLQDLPICWTVGISPLGEAARGAGELVPPPLSLTLQIPCSLPALSRPAFSRQATHTLRRHPHPFLHRDL